MSKDIIVVSGLPRSGTSMLMNMLKCGGIELLTDDIRKANEDNPGGYFEYEKVRTVAEDSSWLEQAQGKSVKIIYRLLYYLPDNYRYKVIFLERDIHEVIESQRKMLNRLGKEHLVSDSKLHSIFNKEIEDFKKWVSVQENFDILYIRYNEIVHDPQSHSEQIRDFLGTDIDINEMISIVDPKLYRNINK